MARSPDLHKRPALLADIVEYLLDKSLATVTFRTLADGLGISTYQLVYHFGSRAELIEAIIQTVADRETVVQSGSSVASSSSSLDGLIEGMHLSWQLSITPRGQQLQRLEFEAAVLESLDPLFGTGVASTHSRWLRSGIVYLERLGVAPEVAEVEVRCLVDSMYGLHHDLMLSRDLTRVEAAYKRVIELFRGRIEAILAISPGVAATGAERGPAT